MDILGIRALVTDRYESVFRIRTSMIWGKLLNPTGNSFLINKMRIKRLHYRLFIKIKLDTEYKVLFIEHIIIAQ